MDKSVLQLSCQLENSYLSRSNTNINRNNSLKNSFLENSIANSSQLNFIRTKKCNKTPIKSFNNHTPNGKTPSRKENRKNTPKTPANGDRFIPDRSINSNSEEPETRNPTAELIGLSDPSKYRIISYQQKAPLPPEGHMNDAKVVFSSTKSSKTCKTRYISKQPEKILDAPDIRNDYYLQLLDWSKKNILAVALNNEVYLWNAADGSITNLLSLDDPDYIASISWNPAGGNHLSVGLSTGETQIWDVTKIQRLRTLSNGINRVSCQSWNSYLLSNGTKDGIIFNHDVRIANSLIGQFEGHSLEICGLKWSPNGRYLASGGNDNMINIWPNCYMNEIQSQTAEPLFKFTQHQAAVKALAWCPWRTNCLASGGGTIDRMIRIWNIQNGTCLYSVDTRSQVSSILWSEEYRELISSHGYVNNELIIWKYPTFQRVTELTGHTARVLSMAMSADGTTVVSLGADETLRFWECFAIDPKNKKKNELKESKKNIFSTITSIR